MIPNTRYVVKKLGPATYGLIDTHSRDKIVRVFFTEYCVNAERDRLNFEAARDD